MTENKSVNRLMLVMVVIYIGVSLLLGKLSSLYMMPVSLSLILSEAMILVPALVYLKIKRIPVSGILPFRGMKFSVWVLVVVCTYLMYPLLIVLNALTLFFVKSGTADLMQSVQNGNFFVSTLLMAIMPAFVEEFMFRGVLFQTYRRSRLLPAVLLSGFLFGCMHMNLNQFLYAFMLGVYMAFLVEATGSILSAMLAHFTVNFTSVVISALLSLTNYNAASGNALSSGEFLSGTGDTQLVLLVFGLIFWAVIALGTTAGAVGVYLAISKVSGRWEHVKTMFRTGSRERMITIPLVLAVLLMAAVMVRSALLG